jgi:hypothetical protein
MRRSIVFLMIILCATILLGFGCSDSKPSATESKPCTEPENPYEEGTGHYAGFEWEANNGADCATGSTSFNEGCEEFQRQEDEYDACEAEKR